MQLSIDNQTYTFTDNSLNMLMQSIATDATTAADKINPAYKLIADQIARKMLYDFEKKAVAAGIDKETAKNFRPDKNQSPIDKLIRLMLMQNAGQFLDKVKLTILTDGQQITQVTYGNQE